MQVRYEHLTTSSRTSCPFSTTFSFFKTNDFSRSLRPHPFRKKSHSAHRLGCIPHDGLLLLPTSCRFQSCTRILIVIFFTSFTNQYDPNPSPIGDRFGFIFFATPRGPHKKKPQIAITSDIVNIG